MRRGSGLSSGHDLALGELDEPGLVRADLMKVHVVVPGADVFADFATLAFWIRTAGPLHEMGRARQLLRRLAVEGDGRPPLARGPASLGFGGPPSRPSPARTVVRGHPPGRTPQGVPGPALCR